MSQVKQDLVLAAAFARAEIKRLTTFNMMETMDSRHVTMVLELDIEAHKLDKQLADKSHPVTENWDYYNSTNNG